MQHGLKKGNDFTLREAIQEFLSSYHLDDKLLEQQVIGSWEKVMGKMVKNHTQRIRIRKQVLYVKIDSAALRQELSYSREKIRHALNREVRAEAIREVVIQ